MAKLLEVQVEVGHSLNSPPTSLLAEIQQWWCGKTLSFWVASLTHFRVALLKAIVALLLSVGAENGQAPEKLEEVLE